LFGFELWILSSMNLSNICDITNSSINCIVVVFPSHQSRRHYLRLFHSFSFFLIVSSKRLKEKERGKKTNVLQVGRLLGDETFSIKGFGFLVDELTIVSNNLDKELKKSFFQHRLLSFQLVFELIQHQFVLVRVSQPSFLLLRA